MGAWIETADDYRLSALLASHPTWVRGLKLCFVYCLMRNPLVAPYVGAWIETQTRKNFEDAANVAPYVGAWIETIVALTY